MITRFLFIFPFIVFSFYGQVGEASSRKKVYAKGAWSEKEVKRFHEALALLETEGGNTKEKDWLKVSAYVGTRSNSQCNSFWGNNFRHQRGSRTGLWTEELDMLLIEVIEEMGKDFDPHKAKWVVIAEKLSEKAQEENVRSARSCRKHWLNVLDPTLKKGEFSKEEQEIIKVAYAELGNQWSKIAKKLPGRIDEQVRRYLLKEKEKEKEKEKRKFRKPVQEGEKKRRKLGKPEEQGKAKIKEEASSSKDSSEDESERQILVGTWKPWQESQRRSFTFRGMSPSSPSLVTDGDSSPREEESSSPLFLRDDEGCEDWQWRKLATSALSEIAVWPFDSSTTVSGDSLLLDPLLL